MRTIFAIFLLFCFSAQAQLRFVKEVDTIAQLKTLNTRDINKSVNVKGYLVPGDGGGGLFEADPASSAVADTGIIIAPNDGIGRWTRKVQGRDYMARWWGGTKTNAILQTAIDWVSSNGWGRVIADGGVWTLKSDDSTRITMKSGVTLMTAEDSQLLCAPNPTDNWILVDFPLDVTDCGVGPARLVGWNLAAPGGDTNKVGLIFSLQDTVNVTIGGVKASNWYSRYADVGSGNINLQLFDENWERGVRALGAKGYPIDDTRAIQDTIYYAERYSGEVFFPSSGTNRYLMTTTWVTNGVPLLIKGQGSRIDVFYSQPGDVPNQRLSAAFIIGSHNVTVDGLNFVTVSTDYAPVEETPVTGYYVPINIYLATNTVIKNCTFEVPTGKAIASSGSYTVIENNKFLRGCGITFGVGQTHNWLYFANTVPLGADQIYYSPIGCRVTDNYFTGSNAWKHIVFFSAANRFTFANNKMIDISTPQSPVLVYTGDLGTTDVRGTNVSIFEGTISDNTITGYFGADGAIRVTLATPTNFLAALGNTFDPDTMVSAVTINNNHVTGTGRGIHLIDAKGTTINGGEYRVTRENFFLLGDTDGVEINGGYYETTDTTANQSIVFGNAFLAPGRFRNVKFRNATFLCGANNEYWIRNVIPTTVDSLTVENCDIHFLGAAGSGDAPAVFQLTQSTNYVSFIGNRFYLTNGVMDGRRLGTLEGTNCDFTMINNKIIPLSTTAVPRGPSYSGRTVMARGNELRNFEVAYADELLMSDNLILYGDGQRPVEIGTSGRAVAQAKISGNRILGTNTTSQLAALIFATNATFSDNIVRAFTGSDIVQTHFGRLLVHNNVIRNTGPGFNFPTAALAGTVTDDIYEQPLHIDVPTSLLPPVLISRAGGGAALQMDLDDYFQTFSRDVIFSARPIATNEAGGFAFFLHHATGLDEFAFGAEATLEGRFSVGSPTNTIDFYLSGLGTNTMVYLNNDGLFRPVTLGANMTFSAGTLNSIAGGGGGSTNDTPWNLDHDANQFSLTNVGTILIRHNDASLTFLRASNTAGSSTFGTLGGGMVLDTSGASSTFDFKLNAVSKTTISAAGIFPATDGNQTLGDATHRYINGYFYGVNLPGATITSGGGSPEGVVTAPVSSVYHRTNGSAGLVLYAKETGVGNTGWVAYKSGATGTIPTTIAIACSDLTTPLAAGVFKAYVRTSYAFTLTGVKASLAGAQTSGTILTCDINENGTTVLSTKLTVDNSEKTSLTAATAAVISDTAIANDSEISIDIDTAGASPTGLIVYLEGLR